MLGAGPAHALAPELTLRPVLTEIGATVPVRGLYVVDAAHDDPDGLRRLARHRTARRHDPARRPTPSADGSTRMSLAAFPTNQDLDPAQLREAFGVFPSGVVAVAAEVDGTLVGLAASSFTSVSIDPPLVQFSIANTSRTWPALRRATRLGVTILADHHGEVCRQLAGDVAHRFDDIPVRVSEDGAVVLDEGLAGFDTSIYREVEAGDHTIVLLRLHAVHSAAVDDGAGLPLVFHRSGFGTLADSA